MPRLSGKIVPHISGKRQQGSQWITTATHLIPSSDQVRFRQRLDDQIQNSMSKISIGPPELPLLLERDLESQLEDVPMVEVVTAEDREAVVNADRREGRRNDGEVTKQKTRTANFNKHRKKRRGYLAKQKWNEKQITSIAKLQTTLISYTLI